MVGNEWSDDHRSPKSLGGKNTQSVHVQLGAGEDIDAHCDRARAAGAAIIAAPETHFYGARPYRARDPEGHIWNCCVTLDDNTQDRWADERGFSTKNTDKQRSICTVAPTTTTTK